MLKTKLVDQLKTDNYKGALSSISKIKALGRKLPKSFKYFEGKALFESGQRVASYNKFEDYVVKNGNKAKYYKQSISYLIKAEEAKEKADALGGQMVKISKGCFIMGSMNGDVDERPTHRVCVSSFMMGKYEVTQGQWKGIMNKNPSKFKKGNNHPIEKISWNKIQTFIAKLNKKTGLKYRLPTEAEWEYACRSGGKKQKHCGGNKSASTYGWHGEKWEDGHHAVGGKKANGFGLYDMSGNVWELVQDNYGKRSYFNSPKQNPTGASSGAMRVVRGGSWGNVENNLRSANRYGRAPDFRGGSLGFRLARSL
jgi:formylglycine-generating enzyme required for sulfatase activity